MARSFGSLLQASLLALTLLSVAPWVPSMYSCLRTFLSSVPTVASTMATPRCLFVVSNIIVLFLITSESKLSGSSSARSLIVSNNGHVVRNVVGKMDNGDEGHVAEEMSSREDQDASINMMVADENLQVPHQCCQDQEDVSAVVDVESIKEERDTASAIVGVDGYRQDLQREGATATDDELQEDEEQCGQEPERGLPADELNRRAEEFIAKFNMDRQLEARMLVCCYCQSS